MRPNDKMPAMKITKNIQDLRVYNPILSHLCS